MDSSSPPVPFSHSNAVIKGFCSGTIEPITRAPFSAVAAYVQSGGTLKSRSSFGQIGEYIRLYGFRPIFHGSVVQSISNGCSFFPVYYTYSLTKQITDSNSTLPPPIKPIVPGVVSGIVETSISPVERLRVLMLMEGKPYSHQLVRQCFQSGYRAFPIFGLRNILGNTVFFATLGKSTSVLSENFQKGSIFNVGASSCSGGIAGMFAAITNHSADTIYVRSQKDSLPSIISIIRKLGWRIFTTGLRPRAIGYGLGGATIGFGLGLFDYVFSET